MVCNQCSQQMGNSQQTAYPAQFCSHCGRPLSAAPAYYRTGTLVRPRFGRRIAGVCVAFANAYALDVTLVRLVTVLLFFAGFGSIFLVYLGAWIVVPNETLVYPPTNNAPFSSVPPGGFAGSTTSV